MARLESAYGKGKWCPDPAKPDACLNIDDVTRSHGDLARREGAARGVGRLAHDFAADAEGLRALRRAVEQGREGARVRGHGAMWRSKYDMPPDAFTKEARSAVGPGAAALPQAARLRADEAAREVRRRRAGERADSGAPARQHLGAGLVQHLSAGRAARTPTRAIRSPTS